MKHAKAHRTEKGQQGVTKMQELCYGRKSKKADELIAKERSKIRRTAMKLRRKKNLCGSLCRREGKAEHTSQKSAMTLEAASRTGPPVA